MHHKNQYRNCAGIILRNFEGKVFVGKRIGVGFEYPWQMPQGGIYDRESPESAAFRELKEETGIHNVHIVGQSDEWIYYDFPEGAAEQLYLKQYAGQRQVWFLMDYLGQEDDIQVETLYPEFSQWKWVDVKELVELVVPFKREAYRRVVDIFSSYWK